MRMRRGMAIAVLAGGGVATTMLVGLVTNAVSEQTEWPSWLGWMQHHAWLSFVLLGAMLTGLTIVLAMVSDGGAPEQSPGADPPAVRPNGAPGLLGAALVLRSLPRDTAAFTNRTAELEHLVSSVESATRQGTALPVHVIDGMPGVGKTSFAVHAGHALATRFPDGQIFVNLNGHTTGRSPVAPAEALASLLAATGVPTQQIPVGDDAGAVTEARAALWRGRLADKKALLILDNAASYRQLEPLLPGGNGCLVLVTSRRRLAVDEEVVLPVRPLPPDHAVDLLVRLSGRSVADLGATAPGGATGTTRMLEQLVQLCGHLPLGLSLLAARLRHHPSWSAEDLRDRLLVAQDRLSELRAGDRAVTATFDLSYRDLPLELQHFFRGLGFYPGTDIDAYVAAALGDVRQSHARRHLDALYDAHLIDEHPGNRYRLHDLLRDYARDLADEGERMDHVQAVQRVCTYYLASLAVANRYLVRGGADIPPPHEDAGHVETPVIESRAAALSWLEGERANVLACITRANHLGLHDLVVRLAAAMGAFLRQEGPWDQAVALHRTAADAARIVGDRHALAAALAEAGVVRRFMAAYQDAAQALGEAVREYDAVGDLSGKAAALNQLGIVWYLIADNAAAEQSQSEALDVYRQLGDRLGQANALADLGMVRRQTSRFTPAIEAQNEALAIYRDLNDRYGQGNSLRDLGVVHCLMGEYEVAERRHQAAYDIYQELDDRDHQAYALNELGVVRRLTGDRERARADNTRALELHTELGDRFGRANSLRHLGVLDRMDGVLDEASHKLEEALDLYQELGSRGGVAATLGELGVLRGAEGEADEATAAFDAGLQILRELGDQCGEAQVLNHWGNLLLSSGGVLAGRNRFVEALELAREIGSPLEVAHGLEGVGRCEWVTGGRDGAETWLREAIGIYRQLGLNDVGDQLEELLVTQGAG
ncbi:cyclophane-containing RiPP biosynthesis TPR protein HaaT [Streptomyces sp. AcE210]|uniref:cyclophane-containing RiPP biosynthesis TPR protein HaaT n=1 Tax=Streptomyces sp. AcE210 TaxID=2292703 RepID=UPI0019CFE302|nr:cyclophane-containing RiPP biosynthesis TPR protein HaaT [Streptomyces sp. AcE210]